MCKTILGLMGVWFAVVGCQSFSVKGTAPKSLAQSGLSEKDIVDSYVYLLGRYLVIRQERIDIADKNIGYNKFKFPKASASGADLEAWIAVDEKTCQALELPAGTGMSYRIQVINEWADVLAHLNQSSVQPSQGRRISFCLKGTKLARKMGRESYLVELPSFKAKLSVWVAHPKGLVFNRQELRQSFKLIRDQSTDIELAQKIPIFSNRDPIRVEAFEYPMVEMVMRSATDQIKQAVEMQKKVRAIAQYIIQSEQSKSEVDDIIRLKALLQFHRFISNFGAGKGRWTAMVPYIDGFGEDYWVRSAASYRAASEESGLPYSRMD